MDKGKIAAIVSILWENERKLSDGYDHYISYDKKAVDKFLEEIAQTILRRIEEIDKAEELKVWDGS